MNDLLRKRIADAAARLARVESARASARVEFEIAAAALIAHEREHALVEDALRLLTLEASRDA
jgi:hypothetical protein